MCHFAAFVVWGKEWGGVSVVESLFAKIEGQKVFSLPLLSGRSQIEMVRLLDWASMGQKEATLWLRLRKGKESALSCHINSHH